MLSTAFFVFTEWWLRSGKITLTNFVKWLQYKTSFSVVKAITAEAAQATRT
jgi:hypothetical protein